MSLHKDRCNYVVFFIAVVWGFLWRFKTGIFMKSNAERFTEFTNCNLSLRLVELTLLFFNDVEEHEFPSNCTKLYLKLGERFFSAVT